AAQTRARSGSDRSDERLARQLLQPGADRSADLRVGWYASAADGLRPALRDHLHRLPALACGRHRPSGLRDVRPDAAGVWRPRCADPEPRPADDRVTPAAVLQALGSRVRRRRLGCRAVPSLAELGAVVRRRLRADTVCRWCSRLGREAAPGYALVRQLQRALDPEDTLHLLREGERLLAGPVGRDQEVVVGDAGDGLLDVPPGVEPVRWRRLLVEDPPLRPGRVAERVAVPRLPLAEVGLAVARPGLVVEL